MCKHVHNFAKTRAVVKSMAAQNQTTSQCWRRRVCASCWRRVGGSCSADFAHRAMFVGFDDDQPQVHEHEMCERCKMASLSTSEFCGSKLILASMDPRPISHASETCCDTWETAVASLEPPPTPSASWSGQGQGQSLGQSHKKRHVIGTMMRKPNAQSQTIPEEPSLGELKGPFTLVRREKCQSRLSRGIYIAEAWRTLPLGGWSVRKSQLFFDGAEKMFGTLCPSEEGRRSIVAFAVFVGNCFYCMKIIK